MRGSASAGVAARGDGEGEVARAPATPYAFASAPSKVFRSFMSSPVISLEGVELTLMGNAGPVHILKGISLDVHKGETLGLVGPSGSGKSSLLMLMGGLETATAGGSRCSART
jgi:ABC-type glutathione transport system ATPase component